MVSGPILLFWLAGSRGSGMRWTITALLIGEAAIAGVLVHFLPRGFWEIALSALVLQLTTAVTGRLIERRLLGPARQAGVGTAMYLLVGWSLVALLCGAVLWRPGAFLPATDGVLPLPDGLQATVRPSHDGDCGSRSCTRTITVTGRPGQAGEDLYAEVRRHVKARGWGSGCRPRGWLLDRSTECVEPALKDHQVTIQLSGNRDDLRHLVTID